MAGTRVISGHMRRVFFLSALVLAGCVAQDESIVDAPVDAAVAAPAPSSTARSVEDFDTTTAEQREAAVSSSSGGAFLGTAIVSLGDATQPGFWLETPLVQAVRPGRVTFGGQSVDVELRPGASARASLAVLRLLEAPLADLSEVSVYAR